MMMTPTFCPNCESVEPLKDKSLIQNTLLGALAIIGICFVFLRQSCEDILIQHAEFCRCHTADDDVDSRIAEYDYSVRPILPRAKYFGLADQAADAAQQNDQDSLLQPIVAGRKAFVTFLQEDEECSRQGQLAERFPHCRSFAAKWKKHIEPANLAMLDSISRESHPAWDERQWAGLINRPVITATDYQKHGDSLVEYARTVPMFGHVPEAERRRNELMQRAAADRAQYDRIGAIAINPENWSSPRAVERAFDDYRNSDSHEGVMRQHLDLYLPRFREFSTAKRQIRIYVTMISIPPSFPVTTLTGNPRPQISIGLGGTSHDYTATNATSDKMHVQNGRYVSHKHIALEPYMASFGTETPLSIRFSIARTILDRFGLASRENASTELSPWFLHVNRDIEFQGVTIHLHCDLPRPPALPPFGGREVMHL